MRILKWAMSCENLFMPYANNKGEDQPAHPRSLISAFVIRCYDSIIPLVSISKISSLYLATLWKSVIIQTQGISQASFIDPWCINWMKRNAKNNLFSIQFRCGKTANVIHEHWHGSILGNIWFIYYHCTSIPYLWMNRNCFVKRTWQSRHGERSVIYFISTRLCACAVFNAGSVSG